MFIHMLVQEVGAQSSQKKLVDPMCTLTLLFRFLQSNHIGYFIHLGVGTICGFQPISLLVSEMVRHKSTVLIDHSQYYGR